nr:ATP-dependent Clp protease adapter ClpS [Martelella limonii]
MQPAHKSSTYDSSESKRVSDTGVDTKRKTKTVPKLERPRLYKVILVNDDYTPRDFVLVVLKAVFRMSEDQGYKVMITAHQKGSCVVAVYSRDIAETKAKEAIDLAKEIGFPLMFRTEPEE